MKPVRTVSLSEALNLLQTQPIVTSYLGKPGCGCGCRGTYKESGSHKLRVKKFTEEANAGATLEYDEEAGILSAESEVRYVWFYFK